MPPAKKKRRVFPSPPTKTGVAAQYLADTFNVVPSLLVDVKNGHVLYLYVTSQPRDVNQTSVKLKEHLNTDHPSAADFYYPIKKLVKEGLEKLRTHTDGKQMTRFKNIYFCVMLASA